MPENSVEGWEQSEGLVLRREHLTKQNQDTRSEGCMALGTLSPAGSKRGFSKEGLVGPRGLRKAWPSDDDWTSSPGCVEMRLGTRMMNEKFRDLSSKPSEARPVSPYLTPSMPLHPLPHLHTCWLQDKVKVLSKDSGYFKIKILQSPWLPTPGFLFSSHFSSPYLCLCSQPFTWIPSLPPSNNTCCLL